MSPSRCTLRAHGGSDSGRDDCPPPSCYAPRLNPQHRSNPLMSDPRQLPLLDTERVRAASRGRPRRDTVTSWRGCSLASGALSAASRVRGIRLPCSARTIPPRWPSYGTSSRHPPTWRRADTALPPSQHLAGCRRIPVPRPEPSRQDSRHRWFALRSCWRSVPPDRASARTVGAVGKCAVHAATVGRTGDGRHHVHL